LLTDTNKLDFTRIRLACGHRYRLAGKKDKSTTSKKIDFSDIPELSDKPLSRMRRVGRPTVGDEPRKLNHRDRKSPRFP